MVIKMFGIWWSDVPVIYTAYLLESRSWLMDNFLCLNIDCIGWRLCLHAKNNHWWVWCLFGQDHHLRATSSADKCLQMILFWWWFYLGIICKYIYIYIYILDETDCISHCTNTLGKGMNPIILPPAMGKIVGQTRFFSLGEATSLEKGKLWIQTC